MIGPSFKAADVPQVIDKLVQVFITHRELEEQFSDTVQRIGLAPFKERVYAPAMETAV